MKKFSVELGILNKKIIKQKAYLDQWKQPVETLLFETLRAIDHHFCKELFYANDSQELMPRPQDSISSWGINNALSRMLPEELQHGVFQLFPSSEATQGQADEFLFQSGILQKAELLQGWLAEGLVNARLDELPDNLPSGIKKVLILKSDHPSIYSEVISQVSRSWASNLQVEFDLNWEKEIANRHRGMLPDLEKYVHKFDTWGIGYTSTAEIDDHFLECGKLYLRRMWGQDLIGADDIIGGEKFNNYLEVLVALSGRAQKHISFAKILTDRHPGMDLRNLLTTFAPFNEFVISLSKHLDADSLQIQKILSNLTLDPSNRDAHTNSSETTWAPIVRSTHEHCILPLYGLEINPFLFLLNDLKFRYPEDWFRVANNREDRWINELRHIFPQERWKVNDRNFKLREGGKVLTDLDFVAYDTKNNELAIFQLKWQQPVGMDNRARRSAGKNFVAQGNNWTDTVCGWLDRIGVDEFARRAGIEIRPDVKTTLFVVARYNAFFSGYSDVDERATWADWNHFLKIRLERPNYSVKELAGLLREQAQAIVSTNLDESYVVPVDDLTIIINPTQEP